MQEDLNRAFVSLSEGSFKSLRRQLPVTRQRVEWEKIGGYRVCAFSFYPASVLMLVCSANQAFSSVKTSVAAVRSDTARARCVVRRA